jgi:hypothetical protein
MNKHLIVSNISLKFESQYVISTALQEHQESESREDQEQR